jgi:hypothetical protein
MTPTLTAETPVPARAQPWTTARRQWLPPLIARLIVGQPLAPTATEWAAVQAALRRGDPAMDRVVAWMFEGSARERKTQFEQALTQGIASLVNAPPELQEFFAGVDRDPPWLDRHLLDAAVLPTHINGNVGFFVLRDMALMGGYVYFNSMNQTLAKAGALHKDTALRLGETGKWMLDVTEAGGLERFGPGFITTLRVRMVHALIRRHLQGQPDWDTDTWGVPINQMDMLATYLAFGPVTLSGVRLFGVPVGRKESAAAMHMWRYIGWLSGVEERWLALTEGDGLRKLYHTFLTHRLPDAKVQQLGTALRREPLGRQLPELAGHPLLTRLKRRFLYHQHLSNSALILGPLQRRRLGLPLFTLPWYPLLSAPFRFCALSWYRWRGEAALEALARRNREQQRRLLDSYFGQRPADIIQPASDHPAHVS